MTVIFNVSFLCGSIDIVSDPQDNCKWHHVIVRETTLNTKKWYYIYLETMISFNCMDVEIVN